jgi:hypothetical protein
LLLEQGKFAEVVDLFEDQPFEYGEALVQLGRFEEAPVDKGRVRATTRQSYDLTCLQALREWTQGNHAAADSLRADSTVPFDYLWHEHRFSRFLLGPVLRALEGHTGELYTECNRLRVESTSLYGRRLWYEAGYLAGAVSDEQFVAQPFGFAAPRRLLLLKAIRADILGRKAEARDGYRAWRAQPYPELAPEILYDLDRSRTLRRFARWREDRNAE